MQSDPASATAPHPPTGLRRGLAAARPLLGVGAALAALALAWFAAGRLADEISYADLIAALRSTPAAALAAAFGFTALSFAALTVYDFSALAAIGRKVPGAVVALTSFCAYAVGNTAGFGPLTAGAIRYRFYTPHGIAPDEIARIVAFVTVAFGIGLAGVAGLGLLAVADEIAALPIPIAWARGLGVLLLALPAALWLAAGEGCEIVVFGHRARLPSRTILLRQFLATAADVSASAATLWVLLPEGAIGLPAFVAVYAVAIGLGVLSHVPAGLGVFEAVILAALGPHLGLDAALGALVLYRAIYHLAPLALAALAVAALELRRVAAVPALAGLAQAGTRLAPPVLGGFALVLGAMLIFSGVTPIDDRALDFVSAYLPLPLVESAHFFGSVLGVVLVLVARGLVYRLDGAWWAAVALTPLSMLLSLVKAAAVGEAVLLGVLLLGLLAARKAFSRRARLLHQTLTLNWTLAVATLLLTAAMLLLFVYKDVGYANELWWQFEFSGHAPRSLRALMGVALTAGFGATWMLLRPASGRTAPPSDEDRAAAWAIAAAQPRSEAQLVAMGDKSLLFSADRRAFVMYGRQGHSWVALSDPVGPRELWPELIWQFVETARAAGGRAAFYQVSPESLSLYADAGLRAFKLGEEARLRLPDFDLKGPKRANFRNLLNRFDREGLSFAILPPDAVAARMAELATVSDAWLTHHNVREKRFSLGAFDPAYLRLQPVAVLLHEDRIVAFASLMRTDLKAEASIDLMRFLPEAPNGVMEALLVRLILYLKDQGYEWFVLGMAPLSGLSASTAAPIWDRVGRVVFEHGEWFYNFNGLRAFKAKFQPEWRPRYLAVGGGINPMLALADVTLLIGGGIKGVIGK